MRAIKTVVMLLAVASFAVSSRAAQDLPFSDGFENQTNGVAIPSTVWTHSIAPIATNSPAPKDGSELSVYAADGMSLDVASASLYYTNVWWSCYTKVHTHTNAPAISDEAAAFYVSSENKLFAYSSNDWVEVTSVTPDSNGWLGFAVQLDYASKNWNIYITPAGHTQGDPLEAANSTALHFNTNYVHYDSDVLGDREFALFSVSGETYMDAVVLAKGTAAISAGATPTANVALSTDGRDITLDDVLTGLLLSYFTPADRTLDGPFGAALGSLMETNEQIGIYEATADAPKWQMFKYTGPTGGWSKSSGTGITTNTTEITPTMGIYFGKTNDTARVAKFVAPYETPDNSAPATTIYGATENDGGWNLLSVPFGGGDKSIANGVASWLTGVTPAAGDMIYLRRNGQWIALTYTGSVWARFGRTPANESFPRGSGFWYRRAAAGNTTWNP